MLLETVARKSESLDRCLARIREEYAGRGGDFATDYRRQDSIVLNLQRACEQCIDVAQVLIKHAGLKRPRQNAEAFAVLAKAGLIADDEARRLRGMVGFRNVAVHEYQKISLAILTDIVERHLDGPRAFVDRALDIIADDA